MIFTEEQLRSFSQPLSETEKTRCLNAIRMIRDALKATGFTDSGQEIKALYEDTFAYSIRMTNQSDWNIKIFLQGSYANNTNIRQNSDVDIAIVQENIFEAKYRNGQSDLDYNFRSADFPLANLKDEVQYYLELKFGTNVKRGNKSIKVTGNTYRTDADAVPCRRYRDYSDDYSRNPDNYVGGVIIQPDKGERIINYPEQHIKLGKEKNIATNRYYKKMVRVAKHIKKMMENTGYVYAKEISSFGLESLVWNVPNEYFTYYVDYKYIFDDVVDYLFTHRNDIRNYVEANGIKPLCANNESDYKKFIEELRDCYNYK